MSVLELKHTTTPTANPSSGVDIYVKSDNRAYYLDPSGNEHCLTGPRRDILANRGTAAAHAGEWFLEDRSGGSTPNRGDQLWLSWEGDDAAKAWVSFGRAV